jgi:hypothetical protein
MDKGELENEIFRSLHGMSPLDLERVLEFARSVKSTPFKGSSGKDMLELVGLIPPEDLKEMTDAIEEGCERVDTNGW